MTAHLREAWRRRIQAAGGSIYRGLQLSIPDEMWAKVERWLQMPMEENEIGQQYQIGPMLIEHLQRGYDDGYGNVGLGRHWTTDRHMAEIATTHGNVGNGPALGVVLTATYNPADVDEAQTGTTKWMSESESEVTLKPGARIAITDVEVPEGALAYSFISVLQRPMQATAAAGVTLYRGENPYGSRGEDEWKGRWFTPDRDYAERYAGSYGKVYEVTVPAEVARVTTNIEGVEEVTLPPEWVSRKRLVEDRTPQGRTGTLTLWTGTTEWGAEDWQGRPYPSAQALLDEIIEERGLIGWKWWASRREGLREVQTRDSGVLVEAQVPASAYYEFEEGGTVAVGTPITVTKVEAMSRDGQWRTMGGGFRYTAAFGDSAEERKALEDLANAILEPHGYNPSILPTAPEMYGGLIQQGRDGRLYLDGQPVTKLYRIVHPDEWAEAQRNGYLQSNTDFSPGYTRASAQPDERWRYQSADSLEVAPRGITLEIDYDPADRWQASAEGYAATHSRIPLSRVRPV